MMARGVQSPRNEDTQGAIMTAAELTQGIQFTIDQDGQVTAVVITPELWQRIVELLEDAEDRALVQALRSRLAAGPAASGALRWEDVSDEWV
jgi:hypothetical protein